MTSGLGSQPLGQIFLAYPSETRLADSMSRLADDLRRHTQVTTWQEPLEPGYLWSDVRDNIDGSDILLAETTQANGNVLFELGYAIARRKRTYQLVNENAAAPLALPPLEAVSQIRYQTRLDVVNHLTGVSFTGRTVYDDLGLDAVSFVRNGLYFLPTRYAGDLNDSLRAVCESGVFRVSPADLWDTDYQNLGAQARAIAAAPIFVGIIVSEDTRDSWASNAVTMLYAGIAAGLNRRYVLMLQEPQRRYLDLQENLIRFRSETEAEAQLRRWINEIGRDELAHPTQHSSPERTRDRPRSDYVVLGSTDAGVDAELADYFVETPQYLQARRGQQHLFVGAKGSGKTALFRVLFEEWDRRQQVTVPIAPADFEFPRLAAVFEDHLHAHWEWVFGSFWRFVLVTEILRTIRGNFLEYLLRESSAPERTSTRRPRLQSRDEHFGSALLEWLDDNDEILSLDFASRVHVLCERMREVTGSDSERRVRFEELLQAARMYDIEPHLASFAEQYPVQLLIDDLDRNWNPSNESAGRLVVSLLNVLHDLMRGPRPMAAGAVFIRSDVYQWMQQNDPEIARRDTGILKWSDESLAEVIAERINANLGGERLDRTAAWELLFPTFTGGERTSEFVIRRTHRRPRHVILFCRRAIELARLANRDVTEMDLMDAWDWTGNQILEQIAIEYRHRYPGITDLAITLMERPRIMAWTELWAVLEGELAQVRENVSWVSTALADPEFLLHALYETGIVGVESRGGTWWFEHERTLQEVRGGLDGDFRVMVHPAFHRSLRLAAQ